MSEQDNILSVKLVKNKGKLIHQNKGELALYNEFVKSMEEGQLVEVFFESFKDNGTNLQLAKIHACIRKLAQEIGYTFEEMKLEIKKRSGLAIRDLNSSEGYVKSFGLCSIEELGLVIETIIEIGDTVNINFRGRLPEIPG